MLNIKSIFAKVKTFITVKTKALVAKLNKVKEATLEALPKVAEKVTTFVTSPRTRKNVVLILCIFGVAYLTNTFGETLGLVEIVA